MNKYVKYINEEFKDCNDLKYKKINIKLNTIHIFYLETICSSDKINDYILKGITFNKDISNIEKDLPSPNFIKLDNKDKIKFYICNGYTIIIDFENIYAVETKGDLDRSISEPSTEPSQYGPKDSLCENIQKNLGLVKRRLKTNHLKNIVKVVGRETLTAVNILYIDNITDMKLVNDVKNKISNIDIDGIIDAGNLKKILDNSKNPFPTIKLTERPDLIVGSLLNGKIVLLIDGSPYGLIIPSFLVDFFNPSSDNYSKPVNINFLKILRIICFICSIIVPAVYIAITTYNQETIPLPLLINFATQRSGVPFPPIVEALIMIITCEILKESDLRFPNSYGSAISILGALILGEAAVNAGIVSPIMIIVIAVTYISSLLFTDTEISGAIRLWRFVFLIFASFYGLYGVWLGIVAFLINITSYKSMYLNYTFPIEPIDSTYLKDSVVNITNKKRSSYLTNNITRQK